MEPRRDHESRGFVGAWRGYQQQALDSFDVDVGAGDNRSYLVLPPGAGKTMIGLEAARRLGRRTLVLVPNTAVQAQWAAAWDRHFPSVDLSASGCGTERDLASAMNVLTYQSLAVIDDETDRDFRRAVLRVVREGDLAPYQELVYLTEPTPDEEAWVATDRARFADLMLEFIDKRVGSMSLAVWLHTRIVDRSTSDGSQLAWSTFERAEPELAASGLRFANDGLIPLPDGARLREQHRVKPAAQDWVNVLTDFSIGHLQNSEDPRDAEALGAIKRILPGLGYRLTSRGVRVATSPVDRVCALSESKIAATTHILDAEEAVLGSRMRALVLCDFERMAATLPASLTGTPLSTQSGSAQLVAAMLAASDTRRSAPLRPLLVTGQTFACPAEVVGDLIAFCAAHDVLVTAEPFEAHPGLRVIRGSTGTNGRFTPRVWVTLATAYFVAGHARVLIGTRALLGEGWDCAAVNVTVDLTSATTQTAITQMRGRALRLDPADAHKVADNWSVCCIAAGHPRGDADYLRLVRKHDAYFAATQQGLIESGVTHCDPTLSPYGPPAPTDARDVTSLALQRVAERTQARAWWRIGEPYEGHDVATIRVRSQRPLGIATPKTSESALLPKVPGHHTFGSARAATALGLVGGGVGASAIAAANLGPVAGVATAGAAVVAGAGLLVSAASTESRRLADAPNALEQLAAVVADALKAASGAERGAEALRITPDVDGWLRCELDGVPTDQALRFSAVLDELLAPLTEPRYLIGRKILAPPTARLARWLFAARAVVGLPLPGAVAWHPVPRWFAKNQKRLGCLQSAWQRHIGPSRLTRADASDGQAILDLFRGDNPLSVVTQLRTTWQ